MCVDEVFRILDVYGCANYLLITACFLLTVLRVCVHRLSITCTVRMVIAEVGFEWASCYCSLKWVFCTSHGGQ
jgi:hypothetical protein